MAGSRVETTSGANVLGEQHSAVCLKTGGHCGLYLNPPEHALVLCAGEKSQIQALDRTQPELPLKNGRCGTMTHDDKRNGTATLFAALDPLDGSAISMCGDRHRHQEWLKFLRVIDQARRPEKDLHLIVDNDATHKHPKLQRWMARHPRFDIHFTPTSSSSLNMVERLFRDLTTSRLRRGVFQAIKERIISTGEYIGKHNRSLLVLAQRDIRKIISDAMQISSTVNGIVSDSTAGRARQDCC